MNLARQNHLDYADTINRGAFYTKNRYVDFVWEMINPYIGKKTTVLDNSCGYGNFLDYPFAGKKIGNDIDTVAINKVKNNTKTAFFNHNALNNVSRKQYHIKDNEQLCIIGNPPYNDRTSILRNDIKFSNVAIDEDVKTRDLGMSFLLSYAKLKADFVCVLHPLSYLIKPSNFKLLKKFTAQYQLKQAKIISSAAFDDASKTTQFPIVIAFYKKTPIGTTNKDILNFCWEAEGKTFKLSDFDDISHYIKKYPNKNQKPKQGDLFFWSMRDINALKRNQTFSKKYSNNAIIVDKKHLDYYIYTDVFKQFSNHIPYYFGNCNVLIDNDLFKKYKKYFILEGLSRHTHLRQYFATFNFSELGLLTKAQQKITQYFQQLLGVHYVD